MQPNDLIRLCYISEAVLPGAENTEAQIDSILRRSRWWNTSVGITGALFFNRTLFAQVLEGPCREVERLFEQIRVDPRHRGVIRLDWRLVTERQFPGWSMAFIGSDERERQRFQQLVLDPGQEASFIRDGMLDLLVTIVRNRESGLAAARPERAVAALGAAGA